MKPHIKNRSRAYYRHHRKRVIHRKTKIAEQTGWQSRFTGYFAKGKVHCSCWMCSQKTKKRWISSFAKHSIETLKQSII
ncbi:hypothetical protein MKX29_05095 [Cytobacillus sp. FSL R7-0696]|uniref:hypothetical protein n=1 Tax=Cytobacillus sp. FSL R7-0696 TaxID=2921691 RepID=UPI0030F7EF5D